MPRVDCTLFSSQPWASRGRRSCKESWISLQRHLQVGQPSQTVMDMGGIEGGLQKDMWALECSNS